jgi:N utilization substance protein B
MLSTVKERQKVRELAMQVLFAWDAAGRDDNESSRQITHDGSDNPVVRQQAVDLARGTWGQREMIDQRVERFAPNWPPRRQPAVDRNLLRMAVYELTNTEVRPEVLIDATLGIAKEYSTSSSSAFVNGVLDAIVREHRALLAGLPVPPPPAEGEVPSPGDGSGPRQVAGE